MPAPKPPYLIQLVSVKSNAAASREWTRLQKRFAGLFGGLEPSIQKAVIKTRGTFYRLRADGFSSKHQAAAACRSLKAKGQSCLVVKR
ncbi:MAG: SPOR domain-containing protein [Rhodospirillaceae bacterium]|nr:SPOR domain-containing protein [Rhodospirillaceae bacterium]MDD9927651.1 SPOR domain-containing protein [Rhodospirillaceae bacterium]